MDCWNTARASQIPSVGCRRWRPRWCGSPPMESATHAPSLRRRHLRWLRPRSAGLYLLPPQLLRLHHGRCQRRPDSVPARGLQPRPAPRPLCLHARRIVPALLHRPVPRRDLLHHRQNHLPGPHHLPGAHRLKPNPAREQKMVSNARGKKN